MAYAQLTTVQSLEVYGLLVVLLYSLFTANPLLIAIIVIVIALFYPYTTPKRAAHESDFII
ncbi:MAG TPA: hypothetical protein VJI71_00140 [Candidatus Norongarragalinales archaeon]|nr:hypothetical protein [Candidatus Norongarragalinales archaeon]